MSTVVPPGSAAEPARWAVRPRRLGIDVSLLTSTSTSTSTSGPAR
jgi:hypothetical protein